MKYLVKLCDSKGAIKNIAVTASGYTYGGGKTYQTENTVISFYNRVSTNFWVELIIALTEFICINLHNLRKKEIVNTVIIPPNTIAEIVDKGDD